MYHLILLFFLLTIFATPFAQQHNLSTEKCNHSELYISKGWCQPTKSDYKDDWLTFKKQLPTPFHASGWFNGDRKKDEAWILFDSQHSKWGVFIFLQQDGGKYQTVKLSESTVADLSPQFISIQTAELGEHETACGKGYWECSKGEPAIVTLKMNGLIKSPYESGGASLIYWQNGKFEEVPLSD